MEKKGYLILTIGWVYNYNDEYYYYYTGSYGMTYEAPDTIFLDKDVAKEEWLKREIKSLREVYRLSDYFGETDIKDLLNVSKEEFENFILDKFGCGDYYDLGFSDDDSDEDIIEFIKMVKLRFNKLHEITINE